MKNGYLVSKPAILHVIDSLTLGGAEKLLVGVINGLSEYQHHLAWLGGPEILLKDLRADCKLIKLNYKTKWDILRCAINLRKYIRDNNISLMHAHLPMATLVARLACPRQVRFFGTIHSLVGTRFFSSGKRLQRLVEKITYTNNQHIIGVSEEVCRDYDRFIGIKGSYTILPNYVEDCFFRQDYRKMDFKDHFRMVTVGSLKPAKNYSYLLNAFKQLPENIHLDIYGDGELRDEIQALIDKDRLNIRLCGIRNNINEILRDYDLFVMSSVFEGHPLSLLEAMACGMPAAVSDIPVLREATDNNGIYFDLEDPGDFVDKITAMADHLVNLNEYAKKNLEIAKSTVQKDKYLQALKRVYNYNNKTGVPFLFQPLFNGGKTVQPYT